MKLRAAWQHDFPDMPPLRQDERRRAGEDSPAAETEYRRTEVALEHHADRERLFSAAVESPNDAIATETLDGVSRAESGVRAPVRLQRRRRRPEHRHCRAEGRAPRRATSWEGRSGAGGPFRDGWLRGRYVRRGVGSAGQIAGRSNGGCLLGRATSATNRRSGFHAEIEERRRFRDLAGSDPATDRKGNCSGQPERMGHPGGSDPKRCRTQRGRFFIIPTISSDATRCAWRGGR